MRQTKKTLYKFLFFFTNCSLLAIPQKQLIIISASYNNSTWCQKYFTSIANQNYENWFLCYIDDNSTDDTYEQMKTLVQEYHLDNKVLIIKNAERKGHLYNQYHAIHSCTKDSIIVIIDGDDWLAHDHVFEKINDIYQDENVWLTFGQFWYWKKNKKGFCRPIPPDILETNAIRKISWRTSHLRTFYAGLFQEILYEDLLYNNIFFPKSVDIATMFPMIEMAGFHIRFIPEVLYIYNDNNPISFHHNPTHQREIEAHIRSLPCYQPLKERPW